MKIAVICALPVGLNPGMLSVDLALDSVLARLGMPVEVVRFSIERAATVPDSNGRLRYEFLDDVEQLRPFDLILFWGDFLHWIGYGTQDLLTRTREDFPGVPDSVLIDRWYRLLLLEGSPDLQRRSVIFGQTLYGLNAAQLADARYLKAIESLYGAARLVQMRDIHSANFVSQLAGLRDPAFGCDCALLWDGGAVQPRGFAAKYFVQSFGRSQASYGLQAFASLLSFVAGVKATPTNWLDKGGVPGLQEKVGLIRGAEFVVTDIYHMAVTAMREGIPVLCFGRGTERITDSLSDKKKEVFFAQAFASQNYVYVERVVESLNADRAAHALAQNSVKLMRDDHANRFIAERIRHQAAAAETRLTTLLTAG